MAPTDPSGQISIDARIAIRGLAWKFPCIVATTANITISTALNSGDTIDGVTLADGDHVLVKNQSTGSQNGIYIVGATPIRAWDMDQDATSDVPIDEVRGAAVYVIAGSTNAGKVFFCSNTTAVTIGSTSITWQELTAAAAITVEDEGTPLATAANTLDFVGAGVTASGTGTEKTITIPGGISGITVEDEGTPLATAATTLDFTGAGVTASGTGTEKTINIPGGSGITVQDEGSPLTTDATTLNFTGAGVTATGSGTTKTVNIPGATSGTEVDYVEVTSGSINITGTTAGTAQTLVTGTSLTFAAIPYMIEFFCPHAAPDAATGRQLFFDLFEDGTHIAVIAQARTPASGLSHQACISARKRHTPTAGTHQYVVKCHASAATGIVGNGTGTGGAVAPMFLRIIVA